MIVAVLGLLVEQPDSVAGKVSLLLSGLTATRERLARSPTLFDDTRVSAPLVRGLLVLAALPSDGRSMRGSDLSRLLGYPGYSA